MEHQQPLKPFMGASSLSAMMKGKKRSVDSSELEISIAAFGTHGFATKSNLTRDLLTWASTERKNFADHHQSSCPRWGFADCILFAYLGP